MFTTLTSTDIIIVLMSLVVSMSLHEAMHGFAAHWLGDTTAEEAGRLTLNPLRHIDTVTTILLPLVLILAHFPPIFAAKPVPFNPSRVRYGEFGVAMVGLAGPLTNLLLAILASIPLHGLDYTGGLYNALLIFTEVNVAFFVFNMIPFPPLDGSRLLYAFAPDPLRELMERIEGTNFIAILLFILVAFQFFGNYIVQIDTNIVNFLLLH